MKTILLLLSILLSACAGGDFPSPKREVFCLDCRLSGGKCFHAANGRICAKPCSAEAECCAEGDDGNWWDIPPEGCTDKCVCPPPE